MKIERISLEQLGCHPQPQRMIDLHEAFVRAARELLPQAVVQEFGPGWDTYAVDSRHEIEVPTIHRETSVLSSDRRLLTMKSEVAEPFVLWKLFQDEFSKEFVGEHWSEVHLYLRGDERLDACWSPETGWYLIESIHPVGIGFVKDAALLTGNPDIEVLSRLLEERTKFEKGSDFGVVLDLSDLGDERAANGG